MKNVVKYNAWQDCKTLVPCSLVKLAKIRVQVTAVSRCKSKTGVRQRQSYVKIKALPGRSVSLKRKHIVCFRYNRSKCSFCKKGWWVNDKKCKVFQKKNEEHTVKISS